MRRFYRDSDGSEVEISHIDSVGPVMYLLLRTNPDMTWLRLPADMVICDQQFINGHEYWIYSEAPL